MNNEKSLIFSSFSDAEGHHIYIFLKEYGKFILENKLKEEALPVRLKHWEIILDKVYNGMMVESRDAALLKPEFVTS